MNHRRRMETEGRTKVVTSIWGGGGKISSIPCRASCFASVYLEETVEFSQSIWKKRLNSTVSFESTETKQLARQGIEQISPPNQRDDLCLAFCFHPSSMQWTLWQCLHAVERKNWQHPAGHHQHAAEKSAKWSEKIVTSCVRGPPWEFVNKVWQ